MELSSDLFENRQFLDSIQKALNPNLISLEYSLKNEGNQAWIYKGKDKFDIPLAIKIYKIGYDLNEEIPELEEVGLLIKMNHPNIVDVKFVFTFEFLKKNYLGVVMEWIEGKTLKESLSYLPDFGLEKKKKLIYQLLDALNYMNSELEFHSDFHDENIIITTDTLKIIDPGILSKESIEFGNVSDFNKRTIISICRRIFSEEWEELKLENFNKTKNLNKWRDLFSNSNEINKKPKIDLKILFEDSNLTKIMPFIRKKKKDTIILKQDLVNSTNNEERFFVRMAEKYNKSLDILANSLEIELFLHNQGLTQLQEIEYWITIKAAFPFHIFTKDQMYQWRIRKDHKPILGFYSTSINWLKEIQMENSMKKKPKTKYKYSEGENNREKILAGNSKSLNPGVYQNLEPFTFYSEKLSRNYEIEIDIEITSAQGRSDSILLKLSGNNKSKSRQKQN